MELTILQRIKRRIWLLKGSYTHPNGTLELDIDAKAGIDPTVDNEATQDRKFKIWNARKSLSELRWTWFLIGAFWGGMIVWWWFR